MESQTEQRARHIVETVLGVEVVPFDEGGGRQQRADYLIRGLDDSNTPLEVTASIMERELGSHGARQKLVWATPGLRHDWLVTIMPSIFRVRAFHERRRELLAALEDGEVDMLDVRDPPPTPTFDGLRIELQTLGIRRVTALDAAEERDAILFFSWSDGGSVGENNLLRAIELEAAKDDNIAKVRPSGHLFVWVDSTMSAANAVFSFGHLPVTALDVPAEVACVWTAPGPYRDTEYLAKPVWRWSRSDGWEDLGTVSR